jgi:hypothetical protein
MEYQATFEIDCGDSPGYGVKYAHKENRDENLTAEDDFNAITEAGKKAIEFSKNYLSNPDNDLTTVTLTRLDNSQGKPIDIKRVLKSKGYDLLERFEWNREGQLVTECSMLEHLLLSIPFESASKK